MASDLRINALKKFIEDQPDDPFNKYALALEYDSIGATSELDELFNSLLSDHEDYLPTYFQAAHFYWDNQNLTKAQEVFKKGIQLAQERMELKTLAELKSAFQNLMIEMEE